MKVMIICQSNTKPKIGKIIKKVDKLGDGSTRLYEVIEVLGNTSKADQWECWANYLGKGEDY